MSTRDVNETILFSAGRSERSVNGAIGNLLFAQTECPVWRLTDRLPDVTAHCGAFGCEFRKVATRLLLPKTD
jgi:hypothetical protein